MSEFQNILPLINSGGVVATLLLIVYFGLKRKWVWGWQYEELRKDRDLYRQMALRGTDAAEAAAEVAKKNVADAEALQKVVEMAKEQGLID